MKHHCGGGGGTWGQWELWGFSERRDKFFLVNLFALTIFGGGGGLGGEQVFLFNLFSQHHCCGRGMWGQWDFEFVGDTSPWYPHTYAPPCPHPLSPTLSEAMVEIQ